MKKVLLGMLCSLLVSSLIPHPSSFARADGGTVRLSRRHGEYQVTVFTAPTPVRAGPLDVSVLVQDVHTGRPVPEARITAQVAPRGRPGEALVQPATRDVATNKLLRAAVFDLSEPGWWQVEVAVDGDLGADRIGFELEAAEAAPRWQALWPWLAWPAVAILLFGVHQGLVRHRSLATARRGGRPPGLATLEMRQ